MKYIDIDKNVLKHIEGIHTAQEISNQPSAWNHTYEKVASEAEKLQAFFDEIYKIGNVDIILTGAGSSQFIGEILAGPYQQKFKTTCRAVGTTSILTHPHHYFLGERPTLLISFARSGDSPESLATVNLAVKYCKDLFLLNVTCNKNGRLAQFQGEHTYSFLLPDETNDLSLAMTSSFSSMLLAGLLFLHLHELGKIKPVVEKLASWTDELLKTGQKELKEIAGHKFDRMVFLGSGPFEGIARESHLKVQELSDGKVMCAYDSFLGFRHGPKVVITPGTLVVYFLSNVTYVQQYELDLIRSLHAITTGGKTLVVGNPKDESLPFHFIIKCNSDLDCVPEEFLAIAYVVPAQIIGFYKSVALGLSPDVPSKRGFISRVVEGVNIYEG